VTRVLSLLEYTVDDLAQIAGTGEPVLPVRYDGGLVLIGPVSGGDGVCLSCAEDARLAVLGPDVPRRALRAGGLAAPALQPLLDVLIAQVGADPERYRRRVLAVRTDLAVVSEHRVRPRPDGCAACGPLPADSPEVARVPREPVPVEAGALRGDNPKSADPGVLADELFDLRHGPVAGVFTIGHLPLAVTSAELVSDHAIREAGYGRTLDFADAERVALYESVERFSGMKPRRSTTVLEASFAELGPERALDPERLGRYDPEHLAHPRFPLTPYHPRLRTRWVHGWSYTHERSIAVPEQAAYWGTAASFLAETSSGCGLGNSLTEAVLHGLFEVAERDAFLMAWYAETPLRRIRVPAGDAVLPHLADRLASIGYDLEFFDATNDIGVPAVLSLARYRGDDPSVPRAYFAAGAHPDPLRALLGAAVEVAVDVESTIDIVTADPATRDPGRLRRMLAQPELIATMDDHVAVNGLPEAAGRYAFLTESDLPEIDATELAPAPPSYEDLRQLLDYYVSRLSSLDLEVIAVDQSDPVPAERLGLHSAKVLIPGTLPMTFGHLYRRTLGLSRLLEVPCRLGRAEAPLRHDSLSRLPHPFP
jgi:ribosomal protein S12 methylthiotransferase accessory factor